MFERGEIAENGYLGFQALRESIRRTPPFGQIGDDEFDLRELAGADCIVNFRHAGSVSGTERRRNLQAEPGTEIALVNTGDDRPARKTGLRDLICGLSRQRIKPRCDGLQTHFRIGSLQETVRRKCLRNLTAG